MKNVLVLGIGNLILGDDGIGIHLVRILKQKSRLPANIEFMESEEIGFSILDLASGYDTLIIVDSIQSSNNESQGSIIYVTEDNYSNLSGWGSHYIGFFEMKELAHRSGIKFPGQLHVLGIVINDPFRIDWELSEDVQEALNDIAAKLEKEILRLCDDKKTLAS